MTGHRVRGGGGELTLNGRCSASVPRSRVVSLWFTRMFGSGDVPYCCWSRSCPIPPSLRVPLRHIPGSVSRFRLPVPSPGSVSRSRLVPVSVPSPGPVSGSRLSVPSLISRLRPLSRSPIRSVSRSRIRFVSRSRLRPVSVPSPFRLRPVSVPSPSRLRPVPSCPSTAYYCRSEGLTGTAAAVRSPDQIDPDSAVYRQSLTSNRHFWQCPHSLPG